MAGLNRLLFIFLGMFLICGCENNQVKDKEMKDVIKICTFEKDGIHQTFEFISNDGKEVDRFALTMLFNNELFEVESLDVLDESQKEQVKKNMLKSLGLEQESYDGLTIEIEIEKQLKIIINADVKIADKKVLEKIGITGNYLNLDDVIKNMTYNNAVCI